MNHTAKLFMTGRSQAVRLPREFRFEGSEVFIRRDPVTGNVILASKPASWSDLIAQLQATSVPDDFLGTQERSPQKQPAERDPFKGWRE